MNTFESLKYFRLQSTQSPLRSRLPNYGPNPSSQPSGQLHLCESSEFGGAAPQDIPRDGAIDNLDENGSVIYVAPQDTEKTMKKNQDNADTSNDEEHL